MWLAANGRRCPDNKRTHCQAVTNSRAARALRKVRRLRLINTPSFEYKQQLRKSSKSKDPKHVREAFKRARRGAGKIILPGNLVVTPAEAAAEAKAARKGGFTPIPVPTPLEAAMAAAVSPLPTTGRVRRARETVAKVPGFGWVAPKPKDHAHHKKG